MTTSSRSLFPIKKWPSPSHHDNNASKVETVTIMTPGVQSKNCARHGDQALPGCVGRDYFDYGHLQICASQATGKSRGVLGLQDELDDSSCQIDRSDPFWIIQIFPMEFSAFGSEAKCWGVQDCGKRRLLEDKTLWTWLYRLGWNMQGSVSGWGCWDLHIFPLSHISTKQYSSV